jgi:hypothetical protein
MRKTAIIAFSLSLFAPSAFAADSTVSAMTAASALGGTELFYCVQGGADRKCTATQVKTFAATAPGGSDTQVQFNDGGALGGDSGLTFNKTTNALSIGGDLLMGSTFNVKASGTTVGDYGASVSNTWTFQTAATGAYVPISQFYAGGNTTAGNASQIRFGVDVSNAAEWRYIYQSNTSSTNRVDYAMVGNITPAISYNSASTPQVGIGTSSFGSGVALTVSGNVTGQQIYTPTQTLTDGATITFDANSGAVGTVTIAATGRTLTPSNLKAGGTYVLFVKQDATGSRTITTWTNFKWVGGTAPTLSTAANAVDIISGVSDGTYLYATAQTNFQ